MDVPKYNVGASSLAYKFVDEIYAPHSLLILGKKKKGKEKQNKIKKT